MSKKEKNIHSKKNQKIVCMGGGNAMPKAVLSELKKYPVKISVISATLDSGGSAGRLRKDYNIISPGDIRRALIALANTTPAIENLFDFRFKNGELAGHNFANFLIAALELSTNDYQETLRELHRILNVEHEVFPVTLDNSNLCVELENGKIIKGETNVDIPKHNGNLKIKRAFLYPRAKAYPEALRAIGAADAVVIGPGDLYSSLAQVLLVEGVAEALKKSRAKKIFVCNAMTKFGETNGFAVEDFVDEIEKFIGGKLDFVIYNNNVPSSKRLEKYKKIYPELLSPVLLGKEFSKDKKYVGADLLSVAGPIIHDPKKLVKVIMKLICKR